MRLWALRIRNRLIIWFSRKVLCECGERRVVNRPGFAMATRGEIHTHIRCHAVEVFV